MSRRPIPRQPGHPAGRRLARSRARTWREATEQALYGPGGFFHRPEGPAGHFRTSVHASPLFARAVLTLLEVVDAELGRPPRLDLVDVGAGRGELLRQVGELLESSSEVGTLGGRLRLHGVERAYRPDGLPDTVAWGADLPEDVVGLVVANEWLDNVPVDVAELGAEGLHQVLVDPSTGEEAPGGPIGLRDASWLNLWWPLGGAENGSRAEVGYPRDRAWATVIEAMDRGLAVAVDYGHLRPDRVSGSYAAGTITGYRDGRAVPPVPDGSCDLTSHVAMDACAEAGAQAGADSTALLRQRDALLALGVSPVLPDVALARTDPPAYARALSASSQASELLDPGELGGFWWLVQGVRLAVPQPLRR